MPGIGEDIVLNLEEVRQNIAAAQARSPFASQEVKLVAVSKTVQPEVIRYAVEDGARDLGENKVQEILAKYEALPDTVNWHLIGHLQTNKVKYIVDKVVMIHSLDRLELAKEIEKRAAAIGRVMPCLLQVNIAEEESKFGMKEEDVADFCAAMKDYPHIQIMGLMTIGPFVGPAEIRPVFRRLRELAAETEAEMKKSGFNHIKMQELSMGMSNDYQVAVEEGATMVRVGSSIFGARVYR